MEKLTLQIKKQGLISEELYSQNFSKNQINKLFKKKDIRLNGKKIKEDGLVEIGDTLEIFYLPKEEKKLDIIYEDDNIIILNKPCGIEVEGENGLSKILNALPVHRLDRNTTGIIVFAKNIDAQKLLTLSFKNHTITKKYYAEVVGQTNFKSFTFNAYLLKDAEKSQVKIFTKKIPNSESISTTFNTIKNSQNSSLVECILHTGKTHQIRASLAYLGNAIIGDGRYGKNEDNKRFKENKQRLHSYYLKFNGLEGKLSYLNAKVFECYPAWVKNK